MGKNRQRNTSTKKVNCKVMVNLVAIGTCLCMYYIYIILVLLFCCVCMQRCFMLCVWVINTLNMLDGMHIHLFS